MLHWDKQEANRLISIFKYSFRWRVFLAGAGDDFITSNRVSYSLIPVRLEYCLKVTFFFLLWVSKTSLKRELHLTASPKNLKEADDMKDGFSVWGFGVFFCLVWAFLFTTPKKISPCISQKKAERERTRELLEYTVWGKTDRIETFQERSLPGNLLAHSQFSNWKHIDLPFIHI